MLRLSTILINPALNHSVHFIIAGYAVHP